jgi:adenine-specific DNA-methyltransferase
MPDLRQAISQKLTAFTTKPMREASLDFLSTLGYRSDRTIVTKDSAPAAFRQFIEDNAGGVTFSEDKALFADWKSADLLFQLTDEDIAREATLFKDTDIKPGLLRSYLFFAIELKGDHYARGKLTAIARQLNRIFPMPVMVLIKHLADKKPCLSVAVINRRRNKRDAHKDVLEKATIIRDISLADPHRGHLDILDSFAFDNLGKVGGAARPSGKREQGQAAPATFDALHTAWEEIFNVELLNKRFYKELANWYFWALPQVEFPTDLEPDAEKRRATGLIRLLTRLIFCWFLKEKGLIPETLFHTTDLQKLLKDFDPESETSSTYYHAILQNLFFATLNQRMGKDSKGTPYRQFAKDEGWVKNRTTHDVNNLYRYESLFAVSEEDALAQFADIPFLNGGLFECLDRSEENTQKKRYLDGFSRNTKKRPQVPNCLFFDAGETADLSTAYGDKKRKAEKVTGLIHILNRYKFTIIENTPIDQEIALDPELLGKVFENLLASYNEETKTTARKQTGSFYTPRPIVEYMVDESLKAHLARALVEKAKMKEEDAKEGLDILFAYREREHAFTPAEVATLITAIDEVKILDPACGSGAFPMGVLQKLVYILGKLDPDNERWKQTQLAKLDSAPMREELERAFEQNNDDYGRKLYLIENCLYGVDIQPIAIQITKLRFFISLVCDQKTNRDKAKNHGIRPLPNLETKFVAADTLIGLPEMEQSLLVDPRVEQIENEIETLYHRHFGIQRRDQKLALQRRIKELRQELGDILAESLMAPTKARHVAAWDPFDPQASSDFFNAHWMFGYKTSDGFDILIGNPPYISYYSRQAKPIKENTLKYYQNEYDQFETNRKKKSINTAMLFLEAGMRCCKNSGNLYYIIDIGFFEKVYQPCRKFLSQFMIREIISEISAFENVASGQLIIGLSKEKTDFQPIIPIKKDFNGKELSLTLEHFIDTTISLNEATPWSDFPKLKTKTLGKIASVSCGLEYGALRDLFLSADKKNDNYHKVIFGSKNIPKKYVAEWHPDDGYVLFDKEYESALVQKGQNISKSGKTVHLISGDESKYNGTKILVRQSAMEIIAAIDSESLYAMRSLFVINPSNESFPIEYIVAVLNSSVITKYSLEKGIIRYQKGKQPQIRVSGLKQIPIKVPEEAELFVIQALTRLLQYSIKIDNDYTFLETLIDACVMECYFRDHMAERDLLFHDDVAQALTGYNPEAPEAEQLRFIQTLHQRLIEAKIPERIARMPEASPELLRVILKEGKV